MNENILAKFIPQNALKKGRFLTIDWIRWVEALSLCGIIIFIIKSSTFVMKIKVISGSVICIAVFILCLHGIKNRSMTQLLADIIREKSTKDNYSMATVNDARKNINKAEVFGNQSLYEKMKVNIVTAFKNFDKKYDSEGGYDE